MADELTDLVHRPSTSTPRSLTLSHSRPHAFLNLMEACALGALTVSVVEYDAFSNLFSYLSGTQDQDLQCIYPLLPFFFVLLRLLSIPEMF